MYKTNRGQTSLLEDSTNFSGVKLDPENRWIKMSELIPWDLIDEKYSKQFAGSKTGNPAKRARMALGSHIIKEKYGLSDEETVEHIKESPYLQWFIGMTAFRHKAPFDASTMTWFRKRLTAEMLSEVNGYVIGRKKKKDDDNEPPAGNGQGTKEEVAEGDVPKKGTLILDATCAPADIKFPTDIALLNAAREQAEDMITKLHEQAENGEKKPRTYRKTERILADKIYRTRDNLQYCKSMVSG
jgi:transposase, IS5 family